MRSRKKGRRSIPNRGFNVLAGVLAILLPPVGLFLVWRTSWKNTAKYAMTGVAVGALALAVALLPSADHRVNGGIELVGMDPEVEVYGPELPTAMVTGYTASSGASVMAPVEEDDTVYVYAATDGECYHEYECKFAYASSQKLTLYEAHYLGYRPCGLCNPPEYAPGQTPVVSTEAPVEGVQFPTEN